MTTASPPRRFAFILLLLGLALSGGGLHLGISLASGGAYFLTIGLLIMITAGLMFKGRKAALWSYGLLLLVVWGWSLRDTGGQMALFLPRVAMLTLVGLYVFSAKVRSRLS